jgi:hypothetical protein
MAARRTKINSNTVSPRCDRLEEEHKERMAWIMLSVSVALARTCTTASVLSSFDIPPMIMTHWMPAAAVALADAAAAAAPGTAVAAAAAGASSSIAVAGAPRSNISLALLRASLWCENTTNFEDGSACSARRTSCSSRASFGPLTAVAAR